MGARSVRLLLLCIFLAMTVSCSKQMNDDEAWVTIGDSSVQIGEMMLYLLQTYSDFEALGGEDVWLIQDFDGGRPAGEVAKEGAMENLIKVKVLVRRAKEMGITVEKATMQAFESEASTYFEGLPLDFVETYNITEDMIQQVFYENYLADQVVAATMENYQVPEEAMTAYLQNNQEYVRLLGVDAEDMLTTYLVHHLVVRTHVRKADGEWQPMSELDQQEAEEKVKALYGRLEDGEDFLEVIREATEALYLETTPEGLSLNKVQLPDNYLSALEGIGLGDYTSIIQGEYGYHVMQLLNVSVPSQSDIDGYHQRFEDWVQALKNEASLDLTKEAFAVIYQRWRSAETIVYGQDWDGLNFLEIYKTLN